MKLFARFRKPAWEHKDPAIRREAVRSSQDPVLLGKLSELAQRDPDADVRTMALGRVDDPSLLARRVRGEHDVSVVKAARDRLMVRLCWPDLPLEHGMAALRDVLDLELLAEIAKRAPAAALRRAALERIVRPGLLVERCLKDADPALRLWLLSRLEAPEALGRIAKTARGQDKHLARQFRPQIATRKTTPRA
jgi:hypothetical protein